MKTVHLVFLILYFSFWQLYVRLNYKWGYIDTTGKEVISFKYDDAENFSKGFAKVKLEGREFYIDKYGNEVKNWQLTIRNK
jgi:negative regulator of sigma E activity